MSSANASVRLVQLDLLRGVAILLVLLRHPLVDPHETGLLLPLAGVIHHLSWTGVDLFFVLSGFLVGGLLFDELRRHSRLDVTRFIIRRGFKIWPPYFVYLFLVYFILVFEDPEHHWGRALSSLTPNLLHLQNYLGSPRAHTWSLAVEEHFYLLLPFLLKWCFPTRLAPSASRKRLLLTAALVLSSCLLFRLTVNLARPFQETTHYFPTHIRVDSMFFGVLLAYFYQHGVITLEWAAQRRARLLAIGLVLISPMAVFGLRHPFAWTVGYTLLYLGYGAILLGVLGTPVGQGPLGRFFTSAPARALAWLGYFSYSIYLWHMDVVPEIGRWLLLQVFGTAQPELRYVVGVMLYVPAAALMGAGAAKLVEGPSLKLRDRWFPSRARGIQGVGAKDSPGTS
ncbi:MAG: hypothetical protein RLZZ450_335 [Pseudomonadota bacterium]|jgi:peptidoglycan/LPS O-acetylase OafA/YrhL